MTKNCPQIGESAHKLMCDGVVTHKLMCDGGSASKNVCFAEAIRNDLRNQFRETICESCAKNTLRVPKHIFSILGQFASISTSVERSSAPGGHNWSRLLIFSPETKFPA